MNAPTTDTTTQEDPGVLAERAVLGSVLVKPSGYAVARGLIETADFQQSGNRAIWDAMGALASRSAPIDPLTVMDELGVSGERLQLDGGAGQYLVSLLSAVPTGEHIEHYAGIVARRSAVRQLRGTLETVWERASHDEFGGAQEEILRAQRLLLEVQRGRKRPTVDLADLVPAVMGEFEARQAARASGGAKLVGVDTGLTELNYLLGGYRDGMLNIIAARTSIGKTAYVCQTSLINAIHHGVPALYFSGEMGPEELVERFFARQAGVESSRLRDGDLTEHNWRCLYTAAQQMGKRGMVLMSQTMTLAGIQAEARAFRVLHPDGKILLIVDYFQQVRLGVRGRSRVEELAEVAAGLKELARDLKAPILAPAQLNRGPETEDRDPRVSDIRESGAIEQDADVILFLVRKREDNTGACTAQVAKNRPGGGLGDVDCQWHGPTYTLRDPDSGPSTAQGGFS